VTRSYTVEQVEQVEPSAPAVDEVASSSQAVNEVEADPIYIVAKYDVERDPSQDLADAVRNASASGKRILLEVGGEW
jgi:hypothetical protein